MHAPAPTCPVVVQLKLDSVRVHTRETAGSLPRACCSFADHVSGVVLIVFIGVLGCEGTTLSECATNSNVGAIEFSSDGATLATAHDNGRVELWDVEQRRNLCTLRSSFGTYVESVDFAPDGRTIALGQSDGVVVIWDVCSGRQVAAITAVERQCEGITHVMFSPDGKVLAVTTGWRTALVVDMKTRRIAQLSDAGGSQAHSSIAWFPRTQLLVTGSMNGVVQGWKWPGLEQIFKWDVGPGDVHQLDVSPNGKWLAAAISSGEGVNKISRVVILDANTGQEESQFADHSVVEFDSLVFAPDNMRLLAATWPTAIMYDMRKKGELWQKHYWVTVADVAVSPDGKKVAIGARLDHQRSGVQFVSSLSGEILAE